MKMAVTTLDIPLAKDRSDLSIAKTRFDNEQLARYAAEIRQFITLNERVLLVQLPQFQINSFNREIAKDRGLYAYPPKGLQCIKKSLRDRGLNIKIVDLNFQILEKSINDDDYDHRNWLDFLGAQLDEFEPTIVGVSTISVSERPDSDDFPLSAALKYLTARKRHIVIAGGPNANNEREFYLENGYCNFVVAGEGENRIQMLFDTLYEREPSTPPQQGIFFNSGNLVEQSAGLSVDVNIAGSYDDAYDDIAVEDYCKVGSLNPFSRMAGTDTIYSTIQLSRGCRADCGFCGVQEFMGAGVRQQAVDDVIDELNYLVDRRGVRHIELLDDDFFGKKIHRPAVQKFLEAMVTLQQRCGLTWSAGNGLIAASLDDALLRLIRDSGCIGFRLGIESGNPEMMRRLRKPASVESIKDTCDMVQDFPELFVGGNYIIGLFGDETNAQMTDTMRFAMDANLDWASFTVYQFTGHANAEKSSASGGAADFVPSKDSDIREIKGNDKIVSGPDVFHLDKQSIPSREQVRQIWFTYNLVANYINNKNLKPNSVNRANPRKFSKWLEAVGIGYPENPYMPVFAGIGRILSGENSLAEVNYSAAKRKLEQSEYWQWRFEEFGLSDLVEHPPQSADDVFAALTPLQEKFTALVFGR
jgi:radical SAM superfamily enzyme YgiQ (UPF0313 family)